MENRKRTIAKKNVESGNEHKTTSGRLIAAKKFEGQIICKCGAGCCQKIDVLRQKEIFDNFYKTSNWTQKTLLIRGTVKKIPVAPKFDPIIPQKVRQNFQYSLENADGVSHKVCRDFYIKCLNLTPSRIERALKSMIKNPSAAETRGRGPPANKTSEQDRSKVINFINLFPKYESHYSRKKSSKKFLHPNLNLNKLFDEYKNSCEFKNEHPVSHYVFSEIFNNNFNLGFKRCHTDTCKTCDNLQCSLKASGVEEEIAEIKRKQLEHIDSVEKLHKEFKQDVNNAERNGTSIVLTFDLQKTLETPALTTSVAFYKRQLWTYNLCVYDEVNKKGKYYIFIFNS